MNWIKKGRIFIPEAHDIPWLKSHAAIPVADQVSEDTLRIYFSSRDEQGRSIPLFCDVDIKNPSDIKYVEKKPILELGELGTFDDNGIMPSWIVNDGNRKLMYYIGWNPQVTVSYRLSIGLAVSYDNGLTFSKISNGPVSDRSFDEPFFNTAPCVIKEGNVWKMWYISCTSWKMVHDKTEPQYHVKYAVSNDGITWKKTGIVCIDYDENTEAVGRPCVFFEDGIYKMIYSYRMLKDYRTDARNSYRLGYAESKDGVVWTRKDEETGITFGEAGEWDSEMQEYCSTWVFEGRRYLVYNGNGFGRSGFGYAVNEAL